MDAETIIAEIECLERIFAAPDTRPLSPADLIAANQRHDDMLAHSPWFRLLAELRDLLSLTGESFPSGRERHGPRFQITCAIDSEFGEEKAHRVRKSLEEEEQIDQRNLLLSSSGCESRLIRVEQTGQ
jgi:hypothetical protein